MIGFGQEANLVAVKRVADAAGRDLSDGPGPKLKIGRVIPEEVAHEETPDEPAVEDKADADEPVAEEEAAKDPVDVPDAGRDKAGEKADGKVQDAPKLPPTHTEN